MFSCCSTFSALISVCTRNRSSPSFSFSMHLMATFSPVNRCVPRRTLLKPPIVACGGWMRARDGESERLETVDLPISIADHRMQTHLLPASVCGCNSPRRYRCPLSRTNHDSRSSTAFWAAVVAVRLAAGWPDSPVELWPLAPEWLAETSLRLIRCRSRSHSFGWTRVHRPVAVTSSTAESWPIKWFTLLLAAQWF